MLCDQSSVLLASLYVALFVACRAGLVRVISITPSPRKTSTLQLECILTVLTSTLKMEAAFCRETLAHDYTVSRLRVFHGKMFLYFTLSKPTPLSRCRGSSVGIATGWTAELRFPPKTRNFPLLYSIQTGSRAHPASCTIDAAISPLRHTSSCRSA
jgi:hypothetical protein